MLLRPLWSIAFFLVVIVVEMIVVVVVAAAVVGMVLFLWLFGIAQQEDQEALENNNRQNCTGLMPPKLTQKRVLDAITRSAIMSNHHFEKYLRKKTREKTPPLQSINFTVSEDEAEAKKVIHQAQVFKSHFLLMISYFYITLDYVIVLFFNTFSPQSSLGSLSLVCFL